MKQYTQCLKISPKDPQKIKYQRQGYPEDMVKKVKLYPSKFYNIQKTGRSLMQSCACHLGIFFFNQTCRNPWSRAICKTVFFAFWNNSLVRNYQQLCFQHNFEIKFFKFELWFYVLRVQESWLQLLFLTGFNKTTKLSL